MKIILVKEYFMYLIPLSSNKFYNFHHVILCDIFYKFLLKNPHTFLINDVMQCCSRTSV